MKLGKKIAIGIISLVVLLLLVVGGYVLYLQLGYYRIEDNQVLTITNPQSQKLTVDQSYKALTYNIGFGAYNHDFSFFMDSGTMKDGTEVNGKFGRAQSREIVETDTAGVVQVCQDNASDFYLFQEADENSTRSFHINQAAQLEKSFPAMSGVYAKNFHSGFLFYPLTEPHGAVQSGLLTLSAFNMTEAVRKSYTVDESFPTKFFDLDRCFSVGRYPVEGSDNKDLVLINSHMSAYDQGGKVREKQIQQLFTFIEEEYQKGNYVIVGGDFNHALGGTIDSFPGQQKVPSWVFDFPEDQLPQDFSVVRADNEYTTPTCRSTDIPYTKGVNYLVVIDGFIVSSNVTATAHNLDYDFEFSDHDPVQLTFTLNK